jgi:hypothetical protein
MKNPIVLDPPTLDHDLMMHERFGCDSHLRMIGKTERRVVWNLFAHLAEHDWEPYRLDDGEEITRVRSAKEVMELLFNLDDAIVVVRNESGDKHWIRFVLGNGVDVICDHSLSEDDDFGKVMDGFDPENYA